MLLKQFERKTKKKKINANDMIYDFNFQPYTPE